MELTTAIPQRLLERELPQGPRKPITPLQQFDVVVKAEPLWRFPKSSGTEIETKMHNNYVAIWRDARAAALAATTPANINGLRAA